jgi:hypothetical protein
MDSPFSAAAIKGPPATIAALAKIDGKGNPVKFLRDNYTSQVRQWGKADVDAAISSLERGTLYKVDLPDEQIAKMLDWDKPLSQQKHLFENIGPHGDSFKFKDFLERFGIDTEKTTGGQFLQEIGIGRDSAKAAAISQTLRSYGIPGIRYLDQGSRAGGKGTSNFVVFDDSIPKIIGRE